MGLNREIRSNTEDIGGELLGIWGSAAGVGIMHNEIFGLTRGFGPPWGPPSCSCGGLVAFGHPWKLLRLVRKSVEFDRAGKMLVRGMLVKF